MNLSLLKAVRDNEEYFRGYFTIRKPRVVGFGFDGKTPIREVITDPRYLVLREKGKPVIIEIADQTLAISMRGVERKKWGGLLRIVPIVTRSYSSVYTKYSPSFAFSNKIRDLSEVMVHAAAQGELGVRGSASILGKELKGQSIRSVVDGIRGADTEGARLYNQMKEAGVGSGGFGVASRNDLDIDLEKLRKLNRSKPRQAAQKALEYIDNWNVVFEDSTRLAVYKTSLDSGASPQRAAQLAQEASINFNKFGRQGSILNGGWLFFNASIRGSVKTLRAMRDPKVGVPVTLSVFTAVGAIAEWNSYIDEDWRAKSRKGDRNRSLVIVLPSTDSEDLQYIPVPVSWGLRPIKIIADEFFASLDGKSDGFGSAIHSVINAAIEGYNPAGGTDIESALTPTIADIPLEVMRNRAWHGGKIKPDYNQQTSPSAQYFSSLRDSVTGRAAIALTKGLSGVGIEMSPASLHYAAEQAVGGAGKFLGQITNTISAIGSGETPESRDIPIISRFYKNIPAEEIGSGAREWARLAELRTEHADERFYLTQQAEDTYQTLINMTNDEAIRTFREIKQNDKDLASAILDVKEEADLGLSYLERTIKGAAVAPRVRFLVEKFDELDTDEQRSLLWREYVAKGIISDRVSTELNKIFNAR